MADFDSNRFQSKRQTYETPEDLFRPIADEFGFTLDVAASSENKKCGEFFDEAVNGLAQPWRGVCWCNPPYREQSKWVKKAFAEAQAGRATTVILLPARTNTGWWHDFCMKGEIRFIRGRPKFAGCKHGLPQPLAFVVFRNTSNRQADRPPGENAMNTEDEILGMIATEAAASGSVERFVRRMSDDTLHALERAMRLEFEDRREAACEAEDRCPDCVCGYAGSETDHEPCERCGTTGKYFPPNKEL